MVAVVLDAVERYMARPYRIELIPDDGEWFVALPELPGCMSQGETPEEALAMIRDAQRAWLTVRLEHDLTIPEPTPEPAHHFTGRFSIRVPTALHRSLVMAAHDQGVSLNLYVATALAQAVSASIGDTLPHDHRRRTVNRDEALSQVQKLRDASQAVAEDMRYDEPSIAGIELE